MDDLTEDLDARLAWLKRWGAEQRSRYGGFSQEEPAAPESQIVARIRSRTRQALASVDPHLVRFADSVLERGIQTSSNASEPENEHPDRNAYVASGWLVLPRALRYLGVSDRDTFVDFGCGKGRVVHQAAKRPFNRVIGVEVSPLLAEIARANLAARRRQHRCRKVEIVVSDVTAFQMPDDLTIGYLYHSFVGETFDGFLRNIVESIDRHPRRVRLIYAMPALGEQVLATGRFRLLRLQPRWLGPDPDVAIFESR